MCRRNLKVIANLTLISVFTIKCKGPYIANYTLPSTVNCCASF